MKAVSQQRGTAFSFLVSRKHPRRRNAGRHASNFQLKDFNDG